MKNEYKNDYNGIPMLVLNYDGSMSAEVSIDSGGVHISVYDYDHPNYNTIPLEDWEQVKEFVDNQINKFYGEK